MNEELFEQLKQITLCGYKFEELLMFADACRRQEITESELHDFCVSADSAFKYIMDKIIDELDGNIERQFS